jgi:hypothetical protein
VTASPGQTLIVYHAEPGTRDADALFLLASHAATTAADRSASQVLQFGAAGPA